jgi:multidrug efflux pump subunit AcrA (membrane-fusion protein)
VSKRVPFRWNWGVVAFVTLLAAGAVLLATGRLEFHWRPDAGADGHGRAHDGEKKQDGEGEEESRISGDKAIFDAEALRAAGFRSVPAEKGSVAVLLQVTGEVTVPDERLAQVTPRVTGVVREIYKARGEMVSRDAPLAVIESADVGEAKAAYVAAVADLRVAERNTAYWARPTSNSSPLPSAGGWLELDQALAERGAAETELTLASRTLGRMKELHDRGLRSRTELLAAEADERRAAARVEAGARRLDVLRALAETERTRALQRRDAALSKLRALSVEPAVLTRLEAEGMRDVTSRFIVRSPIAGTVADRNVTLGETVEATAKIFSVADLSEVWIRASLFDKDLAIVRQGMPATIRVQGLGEAAFEGRVKQIGPQVDEKTRTLPVRIAVPNPASTLRPGMFATVDLETARRAGAVVVPLSAVQTVAGQAVVFVETALSEGAAYQRRAVELGARDAKVVEVIKGLEPGEQVVVANAYLLKSEFERSKISHGHAH